MVFPLARADSSSVAKLTCILTSIEKRENRMHRLVVASLTAAGLSIGLAGVASAADLGRPAPAPVYSKVPMVVPYSWSGFYIGANGGWGWGSSDSVAFSPGSSAAQIYFADSVVPGSVNTNPSGGLAGGQIGYNWQWMPNWVFGVEGDFDWSDINGKGSVSTNQAALLFVPFTTSAETKVEDFSTVRARAGFAWDRTLFYGTGGVAFGRTVLNTSVVGLAPPSGCGPNGECAISSTSDWRVGWTAGAGIEWAFAPNLSVNAEYLYYDLGSQSHSASDPGFPPPVFTSSADFHGNVVRGGLNYKFGGP